MWAMTKRVFLFVTVNLLILLSLEIIVSLASSYFGISPTAYTQYLLMFSVIFGFGGAFLSLLISKWSAKRLMGVQVIDPNTNDPRAKELVEIVYGLARAARLPKMPEVGIYSSPDMNAFATGPSKNNALVAVSSGLLQRMNKNEIQGVLGHEIAHVANGDMVTMTLIQGVINAMVIFFARIVARLVSDQMRSSNERPSPFMYFIIVMVLETIFSFFGMIVVNYFSRAREFRADNGGARFAGRDHMIAALRALQGNTSSGDHKQDMLATLKISGKPRGALMALFSTHPPLEERIRRLEKFRQPNQ